MSLPILYFATRNNHKVAEMQEWLVDRFRLQPTPDHVPEWHETGATFAENARIKVQTLAPHVGPSAILAEDSGLCVDALGGRPGIHSARYGGDGLTAGQRCQRLLGELEGVSARQAAFHCTLIYRAPDGAEQLYEARCSGTIAQEPSGAAGFGYDPIFIPRGYDRPFAELGPEIKRQISHRAQALRAWLADLPPITER